MHPLISIHFKDPNYRIRLIHGAPASTLVYQLLWVSWWVSALQLYCASVNVPALSSRHLITAIVLCVLITMTAVNEVVITKSYTNDELLCKVIVITIDPRMASEILEKFSVTIPMESFFLSHLKRMRAEVTIVNGVKVKKLSIIVCPEVSLDSMSSEIKDLCMEHQILEVCRISPETKKDFSDWSLLWPMNFHPSHLEKDREKGLSDAELQAIHQSVLHLEQDEAQLKQIHLSQECKSKTAYVGGAVIVNPENNCLVISSSAALQHIGKKYTGSSSSAAKASLSGCDLISSHPLYTPTMLCIEGVAAIVRGEIDGEGIVFHTNLFLLI